jgi:hypothetical protein
MPITNRLMSASVHKSVAQAQTKRNMPSARGVVAVALVLGIVVAHFGGMLAGADAYSSGAGQCIGGMAAVGAPHMTSTAVTGSLSDGRLVVAFNSRMFNGLDFCVETGADYTLLIQAPDGSFRGALIRASSADGAEFTLEPRVNGQVAMACNDDGVLGVTHTSNAIKTELGATLFIATAGTVTLDVTVVRANNANDGSIYFYSRYTLTAEDTLLEDAPKIEDNGLSAADSSSPLNGIVLACCALVMCIGRRIVFGNRRQQKGQCGEDVYNDEIELIALHDATASHTRATVA